VPKGDEGAYPTVDVACVIDDIGSDLGEVGFDTGYVLDVDGEVGGAFHEVRDVPGDTRFVAVEARRRHR